MRDSDGDVAVFAHGHLLRVLAARWIDQARPAGAAPHPHHGELSTLAWEHDWPSITLWNDARTSRAPS